MNCERYLSWANAFLVVYSINDMESFKGCQLYLQTLSMHKNTFRSQTPIILVGNKLDMDRYRHVIFLFVFFIPGGLLDVCYMGLQEESSAFRLHRAEVCGSILLLGF